MEAFKYDGDSVPLSKATCLRWDRLKSPLVRQVQGPLQLQCANVHTVKSRAVSQILQEETNGNTKGHNNKPLGLLLLKRAA